MTPVTYQKYSAVFDGLTGDEEVKDNFILVNSVIEAPDADPVALFCNLELRSAARTLAISEPGILALFPLPQAARFLALICDGQMVQGGRGGPVFWVHREELEYRLSCLLPKTMLVLREMGFDRQWRARWMATLLLAARVPNERAAKFGAYLG